MVPLHVTSEVVKTLRTLALGVLCSAGVPLHRSQEGIGRDGSDAVARAPVGGTGVEVSTDASTSPKAPSKKPPFQVPKAPDADDGREDYYANVQHPHAERWDVDLDRVEAC